MMSAASRGYSTYGRSWWWADVWDVVNAACGCGQLHPRACADVSSSTAGMLRSKAGISNAELAVADVVAVGEAYRKGMATEEVWCHRVGDWTLFSRLSTATRCR